MPTGAGTVCFSILSSSARALALSGIAGRDLCSRVVGAVPYEAGETHRMDELQQYDGHDSDSWIGLEPALCHRLFDPRVATPCAGGAAVHDNAERALASEHLRQYGLAISGVPHPSGAAVSHVDELVHMTS